MSDVIRINRAPVLTLWAAVVAERLGFDRDEALTLGRAVAGLNAYSKGVSLGLYKPTPEAERERRHKRAKGEVLQVDLLHRAVPSVQTHEGLRALSKDQPISPSSVDRYLQGKFGDRLDDAKKAMERLARSWPGEELSSQAYALYEKFRPTIPAGIRGWGAAGNLDLNRVASLAKQTGGASSDLHR
ncbi:MAG: hypothetical protein EPN47_11995 [Acidobacteria bacterium]|nr:MAG: hypothetical protein EPN47_11995 [Acidobacteriota bacterium]